MPQRPELQFPKSFLWGVGTSAHQVEGGNHNQWSVWELENARSLAAQSNYQYDDLETWLLVKKQAKSPDNYVSGKAVDHYNLYLQDFKIANTMGLNAWRFSIEWSRVQPEEGAWNVEAINHYIEYLEALKKQGLEPIVTLFHFTLPVWFAAKGGFEKRANVRYFVEYVDRLMNEIGPNVRYIITVNEPEIYARESYLEGRWPPQMMNRRRYNTVLGNLLLAHNKAANVIHEKDRRFKVSIAKNYAYIYPGDDAAVTKRAASLDQYLRNTRILKKIVKTCDFIGINYYASDRYYGYRVHNPDDRLSDVGFDMQPQDLEFVLRAAYDRYRLPILVTENGIADVRDEHRKWWLTETVLAMQRALENRVELIGYIHWSLIDNFEWDKGFWPRFGLIEVDRATMRRKPRASAVWFAKVIKKLRR